LFFVRGCWNQLAGFLLRGLLPLPLPLPLLLLLLISLFKSTGDAKQVAVDIIHHKTMFELHQKVNKDDVVIGW
jgi:hypothetical protein